MKYYTLIIIEENSEVNFFLERETDIHYNLYYCYLHCYISLFHFTVLYFRRE